MSETRDNFTSERLSNWDDAVAMLICPHCLAANAPRRTYISPEPYAQAVCIVCSYAGPLATFQLPKMVKP